MRPVRILCVCGSGTATSAMLAAKLQDVLEERGYQSETDETNPPGARHRCHHASMGPHRVYQPR